MARDFNGTSNFVQVGTTSIPTTGSHTVIALMKYDSFVSAQGVIFQNGDTTGVGWSLRYLANNRILRWANHAVSNVDSTFTIDLGKWYAVAFKFESGVQVSMFAQAIGEQGIRKCVVAHTSAITAPTTPTCYIGQRVTGSLFYNGPISVVAVYSKALINPLIGYILNGLVTGQPWKARQNGCVGLWQLSGVGTEKDFSGTGNHSTSASGLPVADPVVARRYRWISAPAAAFKSGWAQNSNSVIQQGGVFGAP